MEELKERYDELYHDMAHSGDAKKMKVFGSAEKWAFYQMVTIAPKTAQLWLDKLEASHWHNYVSKQEADEIAANLINQDGSKGAHWSYDTFQKAVESLGYEMSDEPYYNCYALWLTANMLYSDHYNSASEYVPKDDMPKYFYKQAIEKLKDKDRPNFIREYFDLI